MRKLILLLLLAAPLRAQPTITELSCEKTDAGSIALKWVTSITSGDAARCYFDDDSNLADATERTPQINSDSVNGGRRQCVIYTAADNAVVYLGPQSSDATKTLWSSTALCTGSGTNVSGAPFATNSGCDCGAAGEPPKVTNTIVNADPEPLAPTSGATVTPPTTTGGTYTAASGCADIATQHNSAETDAEAGADVVDLVLPAGEECPVSTFQLRAASSGKIRVRSSADAKLLPPAGAQTDRTFKPHMAKLTYASMAAFGDPLISNVSNAQGYYFENIEIGPPDLDSTILTPVTMTISGINTSTDTVTVNSTASLAQGNSGQMVIVNLEGTGVRGGYGPLHVGAVTATTFKLYTGCLNKGFCGGSEGVLVDLVGTYGSGGTVRRWVVLPIEAVTDGSGEALLTITAHGIPNYPDMPITAGTASTITVTGTPAEYQIGTSADANKAAKVVHIEGTGNANCDGLRSVTGVGGSVLTISRTGQTTDCAGVTTGTVHGHRAVSLFRTTSDALGDAEPQSWNVEKEDANKLRVLESTYAAASGGYLFWETENLGPLVDLGGSSTSTVEDVTFDRIVSDACFPWHSNTFFSAGSAVDDALINSFTESCFWTRINPVSGAKERIVGYSQAHVTFGLSRAHGLVLRNNHIGPLPFLFADTAGDSSYSTQCVENLILEQNDFWGPDWLHDNHPSYRKHFLHRSFVPIELKSACGPLRIVGNYFKGFGKSNFQQAESAITLSHNGSNSPLPNGPHDVRIDSNIFDRGNGILSISSTELSANRRQNPVERISLQNNLIRKIDTPTYTGFGGATGQLIQLSAGFRNVTVKNNTYLPERADMPRLIYGSGRYGAGLTYEDNILLVPEGSNQNRMGVFLLNPGNELPATTTDGGNAAFLQFVRRGGVTDPDSSFAGNIGIPGIKSSTSGTYSVKAASLAIADAHCVASIKALDKLLDLDPAGIAWIGDTGACGGVLVESVNDRLNTAFEAVVYTPKVAYAGKGANITTLSDAQGFAGPITLTGADDDGFTLNFHSPSNTECTADVTPWTTSWLLSWDSAAAITRTASANGATQTKTIAFAGLNPETEYAYRVFCRKTGIGLATTAGTP